MSQVEELIAQLAGHGWTERRKVVAALAQAGDAAVPALCAILVGTRNNETLLASTVEALAASTGKVDAAVLALVAPDALPPVLCDVCVILGRRRSQRAVPIIERLTAHPDGNVALAAIEALGRIGGGAGVNALINLIAARDFFRTFPAIEVLGRSRDSRGVALLAELLNDPLYMMSAARALGDSSDPSAIVPLLEALLRGDDALVAVAALALANIAAANTDRLRGALAGLDAEAQARAIRLARQAWKPADTVERAALATLLGHFGSDPAAQALLSILREDEGVTVATVDAMRAFGRSTDVGVLDVLALADSNARRMLLPLLGGAPHGVDAVLACLHDSDASVRAAAADALARIGNVSAVDALFAALADPDPSVGQAVIAAIQSLGSAHTEQRALAGATSPDARVRRAALRIISYFGYASGLQSLISGAEDEDDKIRDAALSGLPFLDDPRARAALLSAVRHASPRTRGVAIRAVAQLALDNEVEDALVRALQDPDAWVRYFACLSAGRLRANNLLKHVIARLADDAGQVRVGAIDALSHLRGDGAHAALEEAARSSDLDVQRAALVGLGVVGGDNAVAVLLGHVGSPDVAARLMALASLANYDGAAVVQALRRAAFDEDWSVRQSVLSLLASRKDAASTQVLIDLLDQRPLLELVMQALASHEKHITHMAAALESAGPERSAALASVLARFRRREAERALIAALSFPNVYARRAAATALGQLASPEARKALQNAAKDDPDLEVRTRAASAK